MLAATVATLEASVEGHRSTKVLAFPVPTNDRLRCLKEIGEATCIAFEGFQSVTTASLQEIAASSMRVVWHKVDIFGYRSQR